MRVLVQLFLLLSVLVSPALADAVEMDEGIDYRRIEPPRRAQPASAGERSVEVLEFFWYGCPHCYHLEPELTAWLADQPATVQFHRLPAANSPRWINHARAFFAAELLGEVDKLHEPLFKALQEQRRALFEDQQLIDFAAEQGIDRAKFEQAYKSFAIDTKVRRSADLAQHFQITSVPALVVNGTYVTSPTQTGSRARTFEVINALIAQELAANPDEGTPP